MANVTNARAKELKRLRSLLNGIAKRHPGEKVNIDEMLSLLDRVFPRSAAPNKKSGVGVRYEIRQSGSSSTLYELRHRGAPLRVSQDVFFGITEVLANASRPLSNDEIAVEVPKRLMASEWQIRVVLRFLQRATPAILQRTRSRYAAFEPKIFRMQTERYWNSPSDS